MTEADRVRSTPPLDSSSNNVAGTTTIDSVETSSRRRFLAQAAAVTAGGVALGAALPLPGSAEGADLATDPIFAAIEQERVARAALVAACKRHAEAEAAFGVGSKHPRITEAESDMDRAGDALDDAAIELASVEPTTMAGLLALIDHAMTGDKDGLAWPDCLEGDDNRSHHWYFFVLHNVSEALRNIGRAA